LAQICEDEKETQKPRTPLAMQAQGGVGIDDPFNESQLHIVLDVTDALIDYLRSGS